MMWQRNQISIANEAGVKPIVLAGSGHYLHVEQPDRVITTLKAWRVDAAKLQHRHPITPYDGEMLDGVVEMTFLRGEKIYDHGEFTSEPKGQQCFRA